MMKRRAFITLLGGAAASWPLAARAQQADRMRRIGVLTGYDESDPEGKAYLSGFMQRLAELGWTDGHNVRMHVRWAAGNVDRIRTFAKELVGLQPETILTSGTAVTAAIHRETQTVPIVFTIVATRSATALLRACTARAGTSPASPAKKGQWGASGWSCLRRSRPV